MSCACAPINNAGNTTVIECMILSEPDFLGRQSFELRWWANNVGIYCNEIGWRYQNFYAVLETYKNQAKKDGKRFIITKFFY